MSKKNNIFIAGHKGMVGSAITRALTNKRKDCSLIFADKSKIDLANQVAVNDFFDSNEIDQVYLCAARVGGIHANNYYPVDFIYDNLMIQNNIINASHKNNVDRLLFLGSSCIYPKLSLQPIKEEYLLTGLLEKTNEPYAIAKIAGIKLCESFNRQFDRDYRSIMPTNLYGPFDNFHDKNSHVIPGLMRRFHEAKNNKLNAVEVWGSGNARREFLHVDDLASAAVHLMNLDKSEYKNNVESHVSHINVGSGIDCTIKKLASTISEVVGYDGNIVWDKSKPDGAPQKLLDISRINKLGWRSSIDLKEGLQKTYDWFRQNENSLRV